MYAIDDKHGNLLVTGLDMSNARSTAQRWANRLNKEVYLYPLDISTTEEFELSMTEVFIPENT